MPFKFTPLAIPEVILVEPTLFGDSRGFFAETYKANEFKANGIMPDFVQDNHSKSKAGVLRGLHFQNNPKAQGKLVRVVSGSVFDVAVDIRKGSPTFGKWVSAVLSADNHHMLWVPPGFAHGVLVLEDNTHLLYKVTEFYSPEHDRSVRWDDPAIGIQWPMSQPELSEKDLKAPFLHHVDANFEV
ncbi:MAG: dTDP-4-dehydrorhamnose 3,5-epimerase [Gammaproteobacteria bacterium]|nr:MAG: dTDP-4-dehydrorhamnose 3,5-epimerase [Gammaproteobacteria bacterium]